MRRLVPVISNQLGAVILGLVGVRLVSTYLRPDVYGAYALLLTLLPVGTMLTHCALLNHLARNWQRESANGNGPTYLGFIWRNTWRSSVGLAILLAACGSFMAVSRQQSHWLAGVPAVFAANLAVVFLGIANFLFTAEERHWRVLAANLLLNTVRVLVPILIYITFAPEIFSLTAGLFLFGIFGIVCLMPMFKQASTPAPGEILRWSNELRAYGRPFVLTGIGAWLLQSADRWVVEQFFTSEEVGIFSLASNIGGVIPALAVGALMQLSYPRFFREADQATTIESWRHLRRYADQLTLSFLVLTIVGLLALWWLAPFFVGKLIGIRYAASLPLVVPAGVAMLTGQINQFYYLILQGKHNSVGVAKVMLTVASLKTLGSILAAWIAWPAFLAWLFVSAVFAIVIGRSMVWRLSGISADTAWGTTHRV